jgi:hypothetical protein
MKIGFSNGCMSASMSKSLEFILPESNSIALPILSKDRNIDSIIKIISENNLDYWFIDESVYEILGANFIEESKIKIFKIPGIDFIGLFPDKNNTIITNSSQRFPSKFSTIALWGFKNNFSVDETCLLFNSHTYNRLNYYDYYDLSVKYLRSNFISANLSDFDFKKYYFNVKRLGKFMHTPNHPRIECLVQLTKILASKIVNRDPNMIFDVSIVIPDALDSHCDPVYKELADYIGCSGGYTWKRGDKYLNLKEYVSITFKEMFNLELEQGFEFDNINIIKSLESI